MLFLTSLNAASDRYWGARAGAERFLTKDFEAPELVDAVRSAMAAAERGARGPRSRSRPTRSSSATTTCWRGSATCSTASCSRPRSPQDVTTIAADVHGFEETVAAVLESMENIVDCDLVSVMLLAGDGMAPEATYVSVAREVTEQHYREFLEAVAGGRRPGDRRQHRRSASCSR